MLNRNPYRDVGDDAEHLAASGPRHVVSIILFGALVPIGIAYYAWLAWSTQSCAFFGQGSDAMLNGTAARSMAVAYLGVALFCHGRFCWGALGFDLVHKLVVGAACCAFIGGIFVSFVLMFL